MGDQAKGEREVRPVTKDEIKSGVKAKAGHPITFVVDGVRGAARLKGAPSDDGTQVSPDKSGGTSSLTDAPASSSTAPSAEEGKLDVQLFAASGAPAASFEVELTLPDGTKVAGETDSGGHFVAQHLPKSGNCTLQLPDIDEAAPAATTPPPPSGRTAYVKDMALPIGTPAVIQLPPRVHRGELTGAHFETDKTFLLPTAMPGIKQLVVIYKSFGASSALVVGHTDTVGKADYNRGLSEERAASIAAFLTDDVDAWLKNYKPQKHSQAWGAREDKVMQKFLATQGITLPAKSDEESRRALITAYMNTDGTSLPKGTTLLTHGCGLTHLAVKTPLGVANAENRRVEVFLFDSDVAPPPQTPCPAGGCTEREQWVGQTLNTVDLDQPLPSLEVQVNDDGGAPVDGVAVHLAGPTAQDGTTSGGKASFPALVPGKYKGIASLDGFSAADGEIEVKEGANPPLVLTLQALAELDVTVTLGAPQKSAQVTATPLAKPAVGPVDASPTAKFHRLPTGPCTLNASAAFHRQAIQGVTLVRGANSATIALDPFGELAGKITDGTNPVGNASMQLTGPSPRAGNSEASGAYEFGNLPLGNYTLKITKPGFEDFEKAVTISATRSTLDVTLTALTLDAFVRFEAWNVKTLKFEPVGNMKVEAVADHTTGDTVLDGKHSTDATGLVHLQVHSDKRKPGEKIDLKFIAHPGGRNIGGAKFPDKWTTKGWKSADFTTDGMIRDFKESKLGSPGAPVVFRIGLDFHVRVTYDVPSSGNFRAVKGTEAEIDDAGKLALEKDGEVHGITFGLEGGDDFVVHVTGNIENKEIHLLKANFDWDAEQAWKLSIGKNNHTSVGTQTAPFVLTGVNQQNAAMYSFKVLSEWSQFLTHITGGDWDGIEGLEINAGSISGTAYSFPVGTVNLPRKNFFDRATIAHELSHQIMWKLADISSGGIIGKVLAGKLHLTHVENLLTSDESHPLIEGWAEFIEAIFTGHGYAVNPLTDDADKAGTIPLFGAANRGEHCEGAFANALYDVFTKVIGGGAKIPESNDGNALQAFMDDPGVRTRWKSMIWDVLKDMKDADPFSTRSFAAQMKKRNPGAWHKILANLQTWNLMMDPPKITAVAPASAAAGTTLNITGSEFADSSFVEFDGSPSLGVTVTNSTSLQVQLPAGPAGKVKVVVRTIAGKSAARQITRT